MSIRGHTLVCPKHPLQVRSALCACGWDAIPARSQVAFRTLAPGHTRQCPKYPWDVAAMEACACGQGEGHHTLLCPKGDLGQRNTPPLCTCGGKNDV